MTTRKPSAEKVEDDDDGDTDDGDKGTGGNGAGDPGLEGHIRTLVREAVDALLGDGHRDAGKGGSVADSEEELERRVRKAQEKISAEEKKEGRLQKVEQAVEKIIEKPPARDGIGGKISRFLWGGED